MKKLTLTMAAKAWYHYLLYRGATEWYSLDGCYTFTGRRRKDIQGIKECLHKSTLKWYKAPGWAHPLRGD